MGNVKSTNSASNLTKATMRKNTTYGKTPKDYYLNDLQNKINKEWDYASDIYTIEEESSFGSNMFAYVDVRVNHEPLSNTGDKLSDDFKEFIFKNIDHARGIGYIYKFSNNYWLTINSDLYKKATASSTVKRMNNMLRWVDPDGSYHEEPCIIDYSVKRAVDTLSNSDVTTPNGFIMVIAQLNDRTNKIKENQRFLFGNSSNWAAYKVYGNGVRNFLNQQTDDNDSCTLVEFQMGINYDNTSYDDVVNGVADRYRYSYQITVSPSSITANVGDKIQLNTLLTMNGNPITKDIEYDTSSSAIATVDTNGLVTLNGLGSCDLLVKMSDNDVTKQTVSVTSTGSAINNYEVRISPNQDYIFQSDTQTYNVHGYLDGVLQADTFNFTLSGSTIPKDKYLFSIIDGNSFSITNYSKYLESPLSVLCSGSSGSSSINIKLKGAW